MDGERRLDCGDEPVSKNRLEDSQESGAAVADPENNKEIKKLKTNEQGGSIVNCHDDATIDDIATNNEDSITADKEDSVATDKEDSIINDKGNDAPLKSLLNPDKILTPDKISELSKTNIFTKAGSDRVKKKSTFLEPKFFEKEAGAKSRARSSGFERSCKMFYLEEEEWIELGSGSVRVVDSRFIFVRNCFKTVLLNFNCRDATFVEEDGHVCFTAKSRRSTEDGFEVVDRRYRILFDQKVYIGQFLNAIRAYSMFAVPYK